MLHKIILTVLLIITRPSCHDVPNLGNAHTVPYSLSPVVCDVSSAVRHRRHLRKPGRMWRAECRPTPEIVLLFLVFSRPWERIPHDGHGRLSPHGASATREPCSGETPPCRRIGRWHGASATSGALLRWDTAVPCADAHRGQDHSLPEDPLAIASVRFYFFLFAWAKPNVWSTEP